MNIKIDKKKQTVLFICAPNLGLLDSWIPVLLKLKKKLPKSQFIFLAPRARSISEINVDTFLFKMAAMVFDVIVFKSKSNNWMCSKSFLGAKKLNFSSNIKILNFLIHVLNNLHLSKFSKITQNIYKRIISVAYSKYLFNFDMLNKTKYVTLFDLFELYKHYYQDLTLLISHKPNYSLTHGINLEFNLTNEKKRKKLT